MIGMDLLRAAQEAIRPHVHRTPLWRSNALSEKLGLELYLKAELFQKTGSYKPRGMLNKLLGLTPRQKEAGAITFSAGNAAQGLAYAAGVVGMKATVVMPSAASPTKAEATRGYGGEVILYGTPAECLDHCLKLVEERGLTFVSSYDDEALMIGHSSLGLEIVEDLPDVDAIFLGIGGGGMAGGTGIAMRALEHGVRLIGVEPTGAAAMSQSLALGKAVRLDSVSSIADGLAAPSAGELCFEIVRDRFEDVIVVEDTDIVEAMCLLMARCKLFAEPAGSAALAGALSGKADLALGSKVVCVVSGGNVDFDRLKGML